MMDWLDDWVMGPMNLIDRLEGLLTGLYFQDAGHTFTLPRADKLPEGYHGYDWTLNEVEQLLGNYEIPVYGRTHDATNMYFRVKNRQAEWAEYILLCAGVPLAGALVNPQNEGWAGRHSTPPSMWKGTE